MARPKSSSTLNEEVGNIANALNNGLRGIWSEQHPGAEFPKYEIKSQLNGGYPHLEADIGGKKCEIEPGVTRGSVWIYGAMRTEVETCLSRSGYRIMN